MVAWVREEEMGRGWYGGSDGHGRRERKRAAGEI